MTATKIRQSEFAETHKLKPGEVKALRDKHLSEGVDFWSEGRAIFWSEEAAERIKIALMPAKISGFTRDPERARNPGLGSAVHNEDGSRTITINIGNPNLSAFVLKPCKNKRFVYASLNDERITVAINPRQQQKILRKKINVLAEKDGDTIRYTHVP